MTQPLIELQNATKRFEPQRDLFKKSLDSICGRVPKIVHAVDNVSLSVFKGQVVGLVGESGCGKSTLGKLLVGLHTLSEGTRLWKGKPLPGIAPASSKGLGIQMIFQDPYASINPRQRIVDVIGEAPVHHGIIEPQQKADYVRQLLASVGLDPDASERFAHQFSGGQRARIGIARALAVKPEFLVCDEAVASLDVSVQAQVLNTFMDLKQKLGLTIVFISHDLGVVRHLADEIAVMYLGRIVEQGPAESIFESPNHPYSQALLAEAPQIRYSKRVFAPIGGEIPSPINPPKGCHFHPRCAKRVDLCSDKKPEFVSLSAHRRSACHLNLK